jgi:sugar (pentulose or hexulose) kinase
MTSPSAPPAEAIARGDTALGIELGSTRIKAVLTGPDHAVIATGGHDWENEFTPDRIWSYSVDAIWGGLQAAYADLAADVQARYGVTLTTIGAIGFSGMMHGYMPFDAAGELLVPFRTWRNTITGPAAAELTHLFAYNIPQRWSIAHLYQAILNGEDHVGRIAFLTTVAGYVHWKLTGQKVLGVGEASGMFPIDPATRGFDAARLAQFDELVAPRGFGWRIGDILPGVLPAGAPAGALTAEGAKLLDPSGTLPAGIPCCPPEGDAGTGMVATNSVARRTGNVSTGTSIFAMIVLEQAIALHEEIDLVTTPAGDLVAMVHCNNGASELGEWCGLFGDFARRAGTGLDTGAVFETLFRAALDGAADGGGLLAFNNLAGEHLLHLEEGRPLVVRTPDSEFTLANFMRVQLYGMLAALKLGMRILQAEGVAVDRLFAHGGVFRTQGVAQRLRAGALNAPGTVGDTAAEGGAWGMAVLAAYLRQGAGASLEAYLDERVFAGATTVTVEPDPADVAGFAAYIERYEKALPLQRTAIETT